MAQRLRHDWGRQDDTLAEEEANFEERLAFVNTELVSDRDRRAYRREAIVGASCADVQSSIMNGAWGAVRRMADWLFGFRRLPDHVKFPGA